MLHPRVIECQRWLGNEVPSTSEDRKVRGSLLLEHSMRLRCLLESKQSLCPTLKGVISLRSWRWNDVDWDPRSAWLARLNLASILHFCSPLQQHKANSLACHHVYRLHYTIRSPGHGNDRSTYISVSKCVIIRAQALQRWPRLANRNT